MAMKETISGQMVRVASLQGYHSGVDVTVNSVEATKRQLTVSGEWIYVSSLHGIPHKSVSDVILHDTHSQHSHRDVHHADGAQNADDMAHDTGQDNEEGHDETSVHEVCDQAEVPLLQRIHDGDQLALFHLAQFYFEQGLYKKALPFYERAAKVEDWQAIFQLGVMHYDALIPNADIVKGIEYMKRVAESTEKQAEHLVHAAQFNLGQAYYQGYGVHPHEDTAIKYWLLAAERGSPKGNIKAQTTLGLFYSLKSRFDADKSFFWHTEACGNGSLESQAALGVMYLHGVGTSANVESAFFCLREAAQRGSVFAMGNLAGLYYERKLFTMTVELALKVCQIEDTAEVSRATGCLEEYIKKGIALSAFYYARCLSLGLAVQRDTRLAAVYYSKCFKYDKNTCAKLQTMVQLSII